MGSEITVKHAVVLYTSECITCGVIYGIPTELDNRRRQDKKNIYCPNGHPQCYTKSEADILRGQLEAEKRKLASTQFELIAAKQRTESVEKEKARLEKRMKNGVCPCCHRQFVQLTRHMKTKHPDYNTTPRPSA